MARASNSAVKRLEGSAQGNFTTRTPGGGHWLRGRAAGRRGGYTGGFLGGRLKPPLGGGAARLWRRGGNPPAPAFPRRGNGKGGASNSLLPQANYRRD